VQRGKRLYVVCIVLFVTQLSILDSAGQSPLLRAIDPEIDLYHVEREPLPIAPVTRFEESKIASPPSVSAFVPRLIAFSSKDRSKFGPIESAYLDAFAILKNDNACSRLYGGPLAITALNELVQNLKPTYLDKKIAIRMSGKTVNIQSNATGFSYRAFEKSEVNLGGSFFRAGRVSVVTEFAANSRETRVIVLLHELGHMVKNSENRWVLPDDGDNQLLSLQNSQLVVSVCRDEIKALSRR
jgi:hypothetical protein